MTLHVRPATADDTPALRALLEQSSLPTESLENGTTEFFIAEERGQLVGVAGYEYYGPDALLRSVAVSPAVRGKGYGTRMVRWMIGYAREREIRSLVLLTETAEKFFSGQGFRVIDRSEVKNAAMRASSEFIYACPESAVCMELPLSPPQDGGNTGNLQ
jgi:amino-acid N-acetyltransferase